MSLANGLHCLTDFCGLVNRELSDGPANWPQVRRPNPSQYQAMTINGNIDIKGFYNSNKRLPPVRLDDLKLYQDHYIKSLMLILLSG